MSVCGHSRPVAGCALCMAAKLARWTEQIREAERLRDEKRSANP